MSDEISLEVARFFDWLARNWFIRNSLMLAAFGGMVGGLISVILLVDALTGSGLFWWIFGIGFFCLFTVSIFLAGVQWTVNRIHRKLLGRDFNYLCSPRDFDGRE
jgi:hypothetical protein